MAGCKQLDWWVTPQTFLAEGEETIGITLLAGMFGLDALADSEGNLIDMPGLVLPLRDVTTQVPESIDEEAFHIFGCQSSFLRVAFFAMDKTEIDVIGGERFREGGAGRRNSGFGIDKVDFRQDLIDRLAIRHRVAQ